MKNWNKIKPKLNLVIDFIMLIVMMAGGLFIYAWHSFLYQWIIQMKGWGG